jgi:hypothetical protein
MKFISYLSVSLIVYIYSVLFKPSVVVAQNSINTGVSGFYIPEKNSLNIGFTAFDLNYNLLSKKDISVNAGMRLIGATLGRRGGYFAFGYTATGLFFPNKKIHPGINIAILAGGGAAAPDKDGWLTQVNLFGQYKFKNGLALRAGLNYAYVSGGVIQGFSPSIGLYWNFKTTADTSQHNSLSWNAIYGEVGMAKFKKQSLVFIGSGANWVYGRALMGDFSIHALANTYGGYMQSLITAGPMLSYKSIVFSPALLLGMGGGGSVKTKDGALYGGQASLLYKGRILYAGIKYQYTLALSKKFEYNGLFVSVGKTITPHHKALKGWDIISKAYMGSNGFGNIGARFIGYEFRKFRLMGTTHWAFTHNRGAYAEGLVEATLDAPGALPFYLITSCGAGAGAGINRKVSSVIYAAGIGLISPWDKLPLRLESSYWNGGNIPHWSVAISYRIKT